MSKVVKKNAILLTGVLLPILLVFYFIVSSKIPKLLANPPTYDLLYMTNQYPHEGVKFELTNGKLQIFVTPAVKQYQLPAPRIFRFNAKTLTSTEIPFSLPKILPKGKNDNIKVAVLVPDIQDLNLDPKETAPDGYTIEFQKPPRGTMVSYLFAGTQNNFIMTKNHNSVNIIDAENRPQGNNTIKFLGWIIPK